MEHDPVCLAGLDSEQRQNVIDTVDPRGCTLCRAIHRARAAERARMEYALTDLFTDGDIIEQLRAQAPALCACCAPKAWRWVELTAATVAQAIAPTREPSSN